jgi:hypothetical protein
VLSSSGGSVRIRADTEGQTNALPETPPRSRHVRGDRDGARAGRCGSWSRLGAPPPDRRPHKSGGCGSAGLADSPSEFASWITLLPSAPVRRAGRSDFRGRSRLSPMPDQGGRSAAQNAQARGRSARPSLLPTQKEIKALFVERATFTSDPDQRTYVPIANRFRLSTLRMLTGTLTR